MTGAWVAAVLLVGSTIHWIHFASHVYPYTISQPSSYRYVALPNTAGQKIDFFYPSFGSYVTNVHVYRDRSSIDTIGSIRSNGGRNVHRSQRITIMGKKYWLISADFKNYYGEPWTEERVSIRDRGYVWHLVVSYAPKYRGQRSLMLKMLRTFQAR